MKKWSALFLTLIILCCALAGCGEKSDESSEKETVSSEDLKDQSTDNDEGSGFMSSDEIELVEMDIEGYCLKCDDGILVISGDGDDQSVFIITKDKSESKFVSSIKDGDLVKVHGDALVSQIPANIWADDGSVEGHEDKVRLSHKIYSTLTTFCFIKEDNEYIEIV